MVHCISFYEVVLSVYTALIIYDKATLLKSFVSKWLDRAKSNSFNNGIRQALSGVSAYFITDFTEDSFKNNLSTLHSQEMLSIFLHSTVLWSFKLRLYNNLILSFYTENQKRNKSTKEHCLYMNTFRNRLNEISMSLPGCRLNKIRMAIFHGV